MSALFKLESLVPFHKISSGFGDMQPEILRVPFIINFLTSQYQLLHMGYVTGSFKPYFVLVGYFVIKNQRLNYHLKFTLQKICQA